MNAFTRARSCIHANIVKSVLTGYHIASNMNEPIQEKLRMHASIFKRALANHQGASDMNENTQETGR